jgi:hypothetical protein
MCWARLLLNLRGITSSINLVIPLCACAHTQVLWRDPTTGAVTLLYRVVVDHGMSWNLAFDKLMCLSRNDRMYNKSPKTMGLTQITAN